MAWDPCSVRGETYIVDDDDTTHQWSNFTSIGAAVTNATWGDTILVFNGTYGEAFTIDLNLTIVGNGSLDTTVNGTGFGHVITVSQDDVNISGLAIVHDGTANGGDGIYLDNVRSVRINDTDISWTRNGIYAVDSWLLNVSDNVVNDNNNTGIMLDNASHSRVTGNNCSNDAWGIVVLQGSDDNVIEGNNIHGSGHGIYLFGAETNELYSNIMTGCGIMIDGNIEMEFTHTIPTNNTVNGDNVYYLDGQIGGTVPVNAGEVILVGCNNVTVNAQTLMNGDVGVLVAFSESSTISNSLIQENNWHNIRNVHSNWTTIDTVVASWGASGIYFKDSIGGSMVDVNASNNEVEGIWLDNSDRTTISGVELWSNDFQGLYLRDTEGCSIGNVSTGMNRVGIHLSNSINNTIANSSALKEREAGLRFVMDSDHNVIEGFVSEDNMDGLYGSSSVNIDVSDSQFTNSTRADLWLSSVALYLTNSSFETMSNANSGVSVRNYLTVRVVEGNTSVENVDVEVLDNNNTVHASPGFGGNDSTTNGDGLVLDILVVDRHYDDSSNATENVTTVNVKFRGWSDSRDVNMSTSHTETFNYTETGTVLYVDDDNAGDPSMDGSEEHPYDTIQRGIDNSTENGTVFVWSGTYAENVHLNVSGLRLVGNGSANTTVDGSNSGTVVLVDVPNTSITGLHITDAGTNSEDSGVHFDNNSSFSMWDCLLDQSQRGVFIEDATDVTLDDLSVNNNAFGVYVLNSQVVTVSASAVASNTNTGIYVDTGVHVLVSGCTVHSNPTNGVYETTTSNLTVINTNFTSNGEGVYATGGEDLRVIDCTIVSSTSNGVALRADADWFLVEGCEIRSNNNGITAQSSLGEIGNTTIIDSTSNDIELATNADVTTYNVSFDGTEVSCDLTSVLTVRNYLTVRAVNQYGEGIKDADVMVEDNDDAVYASEGYGGTDQGTSGRGFTPEMVITDRIYDGSNTPTQNWTNASAKFDGEEVTVEVNMSTSHTETIEINVSLEGIVFVDLSNQGDPEMNGSLEHPYDTIGRGLDNATNGDTVRVFAGVYEEQVVIEKEVTLKGNASGTQIKAVENENGIVVNAPNVTVEEVFVNRSAGSEVGVNGTDAAWNLTVRSVEVKGFDYGVSVGMVENIVLHNLTIVNPDYGVYLLNCTTLSVIDSWISHRELNDTASGIMIENCINGSILNNTVNNYYYSVRAEVAWNITIVENTLDNGYALVYSGGDVHDMSVTGNEMTNGTIGIGLVDIPADSENINASGNRIKHIDNQAIYMYGVSGAEVGWNTIEDSTAGIHSVNNGLVRAHNNTISDVQTGVSSQLDSGMTLNDNVVRNASARGISVTTTSGDPHPDSTLDGNTVSNSTIGIYLRDVEDVLVRYNRIENCTDRGLVINSSSSLIVENNVLNNNTLNMDVGGSSLEEYYHIIRKSNKVNELPVYYKINDTDVDISGGMGYAAFINCSGDVENADVEPNSQGMLFIISDSLTVTNTTVEGSDVQFTIRETNITVLNTPFERDRSEIDANSTLTVQNYLHVHVNDTSAQDLEGADVKVTDNNDTVYASPGYGGSEERTDSDGYVMWIIVTDRVHHGPGEPTENLTFVSVKNNTWEEKERNVSMNSTHTEWFEEGGGPGNERPLVSILEPGEGDPVGGENVDISGEASDPDGTVIRVEVRIDHNGTWRTCQGTENWTYRWDSTEVEDGEHTIFARSWDGDLYSAEDLVNVTVDNTNFAPNVSINVPVEDETVEDEITIEGNASDPDGNDDVDLVEVAITWNGSEPGSGDWRNASDTSGNDTWVSWEYIWNTSDVEDGDYTLWARAHDGIAYSDLSQVNVTVYNPDPPLASIRLPQENEEVNGTYIINGTAMDQDPDGEVEKVYVAVAEAGEEPQGPDWKEATDTSGNGTWETWEFEWDTTELDDGNYTIHAQSYDGNETSRIAKVNVSIENVNYRPRIVTESPEEGEGVSGTVNVTGFARDIDDEIEHINVSIDDQEVQDDRLVVNIEKVSWDRWEWWAEWDTSSWNEGEHTIHARATDERGRYREPAWAVNVTVFENIPPTLDFINPGEGESDDVYKGETDSYIIQWEDDDPDDDATIDLYYDEDDDGEGGVEIVLGLSEDEEDGSGHEKDDHEWDISGMDEGTYYLYAVLSDGENADVVVVSDGTVTIHEGMPNEAPEVVVTQPNGSSEDVIDENGTYTIHFSASDADGDDLTIHLYYDNDTDPTSYEDRITTSPLDQDDTEFEWTTPGITGKYYIHAKVNDGTETVWGTSPGVLTIGDVVAPAGVGNLTVEDPGFGETLALTFNRPGDDRWQGTPEDYEIRFSTSSIQDEDDWDSATVFSGGITYTNTIGNEIEMTITPWTAPFVDGTEYNVAIRYRDEVGNMGPIESGSATPSFDETTGRTIRGLPSGYSATYGWVGTGTIDAEDRVGMYSVSGTGLATFDDIYVSLESSGWVTAIKLDINYPEGQATVDTSDAKVYRRTLTGWEAVERTGVHEANRTIWAVLDELSIFAPLGLPIGEPEVELSWSPQSPEEDQRITFEVVYTDPAGRAYNTIFIKADDQRISLTEVNGTPEEGIVFTASEKLDPGSYSIYVEYTYGDPEVEDTTTAMSLIVKEKDEDEGLPMGLVLGAVGVVILLLIVLMAVRSRRKQASAKKEEGKPDVVEATVATDAFEDVGEPVTAEVPVEVEATVAEPAGEVPPHVAKAAAKAEDVTPAETPPALQVPVPGAPPAAVEPTVPATPPPQLELPDVPEGPAADVEPEVVEADLTDTGKLIFAPCPSCGNRLIIPKERPVDIACEKCGEEFTVN